MLSQANSFGLTGLNGFPVKVEVYISGGLHAYETVGLPDAAVKESVTFVPVETLEEALTLALRPEPNKKDPSDRKPDYTSMPRIIPDPVPASASEHPVL